VTQKQMAAASASVQDLLKAEQEARAVVDSARAGMLF
jgi:hypothetical protein